MPLTLNCPKCKTPFKVRDDALGQKVKCPTCAAVLAVPANIGPTSITDIPIDPSPGRQSSPYGAAPPPVPPRPIQESGRINSDDPETLGLEENPQDLEKHLASPSMKNLGSRGRVESTRAMPNSPPAPNRSRPAMPAPTPVGKRNQPVPVGEESEQFRGWRSVARGFRLIQFGLWFVFLPWLCEAGKYAYFYFAKVNPSEGKGFLGIGTLWHEITLLYVGVPVLLGMVLTLFGLMGLRGVPRSSEARGVATGTLLFETIVFLGIVALAAYVGLTQTRTVNDSVELRLGVAIVTLVTLFFILLSGLWYLLFLCQIGFPIGDPTMTRRVANFVLSLFVLVAIPIGVDQYYPIFEEGARFPHIDPELHNILFWGGAAAMVFILFFLFTRLAGKARKAIWRMIQDREPVMVMAR